MLKRASGALPPKVHAQLADSAGMRYLSVCLLYVVLAGCGDGLNQGAPDAQDMRYLHPPALTQTAHEQLFVCSGASQEGCRESLKCGIVGQEWDCVAPGIATLSAPCTVGSSGDDCQAGLHCYQGICHSLCAANTTCGEVDSQCIPIPSEAPELNICLANCSAVDQDCPMMAGEQRQGCYLHVTGPVCAPVAKSPPTIPGSACSYLNECAIGSGCVEIGGRAQCRAYCDFQNNGDSTDPRCAPDALCRSLERSPTVGVCQ